MLDVFRHIRANLPIKYVFSVVRLAPLKTATDEGPLCDWMRRKLSATTQIARSYAIGRNPPALDGSRSCADKSRSGCEPCKYRFTPFGQSIPRLKGNSSQGSKPMTSLSLTLS